MTGNWNKHLLGYTTPYRCPRGHEVVYNGNYFCAAWDHERCWALSHPPKGPDRAYDTMFHDTSGWQCCPQEQ